MQNLASWIPIWSPQDGLSTSMRINPTTILHHNKCCRSVEPARNARGRCSPLTLLYIMKGDWLIIGRKQSVRLPILRKRCLEGSWSDYANHVGDMTLPSCSLCTRTRRVCVYPALGRARRTGRQQERDKIGKHGIDTLVDIYGLNFC